MFEHFIEHHEILINKGSVLRDFYPRFLQSIFQAHKYYCGKRKKLFKTCKFLLQSGCCDERDWEEIDIAKDFRGFDFLFGGGHMGLYLYTECIMTRAIFYKIKHF